jgi:hypothetical protein
MVVVIPSCLGAGTIGTGTSQITKVGIAKDGQGFARS